MPRLNTRTDLNNQINADLVRKLVLSKHRSIFIDTIIPSFALRNEIPDVSSFRTGSQITDEINTAINGVPSRRTDTEINNLARIIVDGRIDNNNLPNTGGSTTDAPSIAAVVRAITAVMAAGDDAYIWATVGNDSELIPDDKIPQTITRDTQLSGFRTESQISTLIANAIAGVPPRRTDAEINALADDRIMVGVLDFAEAGNTDVVPDNKFTTQSRPSINAGEYQVVATDSSGNRVWRTLGSGGMQPPVDHDFDFEWRSGTAGAFTTIMTSDGANVDFDPVIPAGGSQFTFRVPDTHRITSIQFGFSGLYATNEVADWMETITGGYAVYTRDGFTPNTYNCRVIGGPN